jgi:hypothetical protein
MQKAFNRAAFRLYYRAVFCERFSELNPAAQDSGAAALVASALQWAAAGNLASAQQGSLTRGDGDLGCATSAKSARTPWKAPSTTRLRTAPGGRTLVC